MVAELGPMVGKRTRPKIANDITELIGNTPLLKLGRNAEGLDATILLKMEAMEVTRGRSALGEAWGGGSCLSHTFVKATKNYLHFGTPEQL